MSKSGVSYIYSNIQEMTYIRLKTSSGNAEGVKENIKELILDLELKNISKIETV